ncbi:DUF488 domain-containing protein [Chryseobacterium indologenes]|uniref:DUF488 domain-containing protein n=2 Tax=Chryseobacterium indologenes TaxID=253 RepID=UPI0011088BBB|nr:DUF488 domain-containing protein [Chryseobacterium indologenes]TLX24043.1 DUF488 domain-containing protein [Chryseobacterium indologenes]
MQTQIFSIGYGNRQMNEFIKLLENNEISLLVDVRTNPYSRWRPEFNTKAFQITLAEFGLQYIHKPELGGKPKDEEFYTNGNLDYDKLRRSVSYQQGLEYLERGLEFDYRIAIMCSEQNPLECHRYNLIGEDLHRRGWEVIHIGKQGELLPHTTGLF